MKIKPKAVEAATSISELVSMYNQAFAEVKTQLIDRNNVIDEIARAILVHHHILLEGPPGVAKSYLANKVFEHFSSDTKIYRRQFRKGTQLEEIFGPLNIQKFQKESQWEYNTAGMLPEAHFAFLDEVFRASDSALPSMMSILNERRFENGIKTMKCPLISAVGTTNFTSDNPELCAFSDRWLIRLMVNPLEDSNSRLMMLNQFMDATLKDSDDSPTLISLEDLRALHKAVLKIQFNKLIYGMYEQIVSLYAKQTKAVVSDRRFCQAALIMKSAILLEGNPADPDPACILCTKSAILQDHNRDHEQAFDAAYSKIVGDYQVVAKESPLVEKAIEYAQRFIRDYDPQADKDIQKKQFNKVLKFRQKLVDSLSTQTIKSASSVEQINQVLMDLDKYTAQFRVDSPELYHELQIDDSVGTIDPTSPNIDWAQGVSQTTGSMYSSQKPLL